LSPLKLRILPHPRRLSHGHILFLFLCLAACLFGLSLSAHALDCLSLEGVHPFSPGDDPAWAAPSFDDRLWKRVRVPGDLKAQGIRQKPGVGWYRIHFRPAEDLKGAAFGLALGNIGNADEVYLNGVWIGGEGLIKDRFVEAPWKERLYRIPEGLLRLGENNVLGVRILDTYRMAGIFEGPVCLGDYEDLILKARALESMRKGLEIAFFTLLFFFFLVSGFLLVQRIKSPGYGSFMLFVGLYMALFILESLYIYEAGLKSSLVQRAIFTIASLLPAAGLFFMVNLYPIARGAWITTLMVSSLGLSAAFLFFPGLRAYAVLLTIFLILTACTGGTALFLTVRSFLRGRQESGPILLGICGLVAGLVYEVAPIGGHWHKWPISPADLGMAFLVITMAYAIIAGYARAAETVKSLSAHILEAHEEERKRLSRNIHDGLGQFLPMLKLQLQMLESKMKSGGQADPDVLGRLVTEVSKAIVDLRHMVTDIRPEFFEKSFLSDILKWHAEQFSERTGIKVGLARPRKPIMDPRLRENLYRIVQEALYNVEKHAEAGQVNIELRHEGRQIIMNIRDDGKGFRPSPDAEARGIGLLSMKERAELLGGSFRVQSAPGKGCVIEVEVPVP